MLSHELRTPLTPILAAADALRDVELSEAVREAVAVIRRNVMIESRLVDDLLDVARLTAEAAGGGVEPLSLHRLIDLVAGGLGGRGDAGRHRRAARARRNPRPHRGRTPAASARSCATSSRTRASSRSPAAASRCAPEDADGFVRVVRRRHGPRDDARGGRAALRAVRRGAPAVRQPRRARPRARDQPRHRRGPRRPHPRPQPRPRPRDDGRDRAADDYGGRGRPGGSPRMQPAPKQPVLPRRPPRLRRTRNDSCRRDDGRRCTAASGGTPAPTKLRPPAAACSSWKTTRTARRRSHSCCR